jgi:hypothetical protein
MRTNRLFIISIVAALSPGAFAQEWEVGGGAGLGMYTSQNVENPSLTGSAKVGLGVAASAWLANNTSEFWGGELRYDFQQGDLRVSSGGNNASFGGKTHAVHYDMQLHFAEREASIRPFVAFGGGVKVYRGTGEEVAFQPLNRLALLTKTSDLRPLVSLGAGIKLQRGRMGFRIEAHDYMTPFPDKVIAPAQNSSVGGWLHDFVASVGLSLLF